MGVPRISRPDEEEGVEPAGNKPDRTIWLLVASGVMLVIAVALIALVIITLLRGSRDASTAGESPPSISVAPALAEPGALLSVSGEGWQAEEDVAISLAPVISGSDGEPVQYAVAQAGVYGHWQTQVPLALDEAWGNVGVARIIARGQESGYVATVEVTVLPRPTATPAAGAMATETATRLIFPTSEATTTATDYLTPTPIVVTPVPTATPYAPPTPTSPPTRDASRWRGEYYANTGLAGTPALIRDDTYVDFDWGAAGPAAGLPADGFSVRWTHTLYFEASTYRFRIDVDDGVRMRIDGQYVIDSWTVGSLRTLEADHALTSGYHTIVIEYFEQSGLAAIGLSWMPVAAYPDWKGEYFGNADVSGTPLVVRNDTAIDFDWGASAPANGVPADYFSARWTRTLWFEEGAYRFNAMVDDGMRLWVDGHLVIDHWQDGSVAQYDGYRYLLSGSHEIRVEYYDRIGNAVMRLWWDRLTTFSNWRGEYYSNQNLSWPPALVRNDGNIDFDWSSAAPATGLPQESFSVRWTGWVDFGSQFVRFHIGSDDGVRVWIDGRQIVDRWYNQPYGVYDIDSEVGWGAHEVRVEYYQSVGGARILFGWTPLQSPTSTAGLPPTSTLTPTMTHTPTATRTPTQTVTITATGTSEIPPTSTPTPMVWPTVTPQAAGNRQIAVEPQAAEVGDTITVTGQNWPTGRLVYLEFALADGSLVGIKQAEVKPAADGTFKQKLLIDSGWESEVGLLVVARQVQPNAPEDLRTTWLPLGANVEVKGMDVTGASVQEDPGTRIYLTEEEWLAVHPEKELTKEPEPANQFMRLLRRLGIGDEPGIEVPITEEPEKDVSTVDWEKTIVAEVCLGEVPAHSMTVDIIGAGAADEIVQVVVEIAPPTETLSVVDRSREAESDYPCAAVEIPRAELPEGDVLFYFITTRAQYLPAFWATL